jgi:hypothetical protein
MVLSLLLSPVSGEVILQFFNNSWNEINDKLPEIAEVGYQALWLPPPQKASGALSVGYDLWDPFDLGGKDQRGTIRTRYGTEEELLRLIANAHRFGLRVYFDNIMNHRAFDIPGYDENTAVDIYPGMLPEDFHLRVTEEGFYRKWDNTANWGSTWEVQYRNLSDLIDIAHEDPNGNFGPNEGDTHPKISLVRHPDNPEYYDYHPTLGHVGFGTTNITKELLTNNADYYSENVGGYLMRSIRWLVDYTKVDGLRLDAVKHVPGYFFGEQYAGDKDSSDAGYCGQAQWQFNHTRGYTDWDNHRDTVFDTELAYGRNDLMMFGEHMGEPPPYGDYWDAGMRLLDARTHATLNSQLGNPWGTLSGLDSANYIEGFQMGQSLGVYYAKSHDDNIAYREELHNALNLTRAGLPDIYTDGNRQAETLGQSGGAFPRHANTAYLGQWGDDRIPNLVYVHNHFARSWQIPRWSDSDVVAYDRLDFRENSSMSSNDACALTFMMNDNYSAGEYREIPTAFPEGAYLWQYASGGGNFYTTVSGGKISVIIPAGGYFAFSWRSPEESDLWSSAGGNPVTIHEADGSQAGWVSYERTDGPDGDPGFNPYGVSDSNTTDYAYTYYVPRVTSSSNLSFVTRVDGSAYNVLMKLDGGMNLNTNTHSSGDPRDHPPGNEGSTAVYEGYEQVDFLFRQYREKFAAKDTVRNTIGSAGSESYVFTVGDTNITVNNGGGSNDYDNTYTASFVYHDPEATITASNASSVTHIDPAPEDAAGSNITAWVKIGNGCDVNRVFLYYTTNATTYPEGAGGSGVDNDTHVIELAYHDADQSDGTIDWWKGTLPAMPSGTEVRYKIGASRRQGPAEGCSPAFEVPFPSDSTAVARKKKMMGVWHTTNINPATITYRPHNDFGMVSTGLVDGFHILRARAFLQRDGAGVGNDLRAAIYNTFKQVFYLDTETPQGEIVFPDSGTTYEQTQYGAVVRTDPTVTEVWYNIQDDSDANDDGQTGNEYGNGTNAAGETAWVEAYEVTPSLSIDSEYPREFRFTYQNIPTNGEAVVRIRLKEISSSDDFSYSPIDGHYTELTSTNDASAPDEQFYFDWPTQDGTSVQEGWTIRLLFTPSVADGYNDTEMTNAFLIKINDVAQGRSEYRVQRDRGDGKGQLEYDLPDLYNGNSNFLHHIAVTFEKSGGVTLQAHRYVTAHAVNSGPSIQITDPPQFDQDGAAYIIELPDVASPSSTQRQYQVQVETDTSVQYVWLDFQNDAGQWTPIEMSTNEVTGTVAVINGSTSVVGTGTAFNTELSVGNVLLINTSRVMVSQVLSDTNLTLNAAFTGASGSGITAYRLEGNPMRTGSALYWRFLWTNISEGGFTFTANANTNAANSNSIHASATRSTTVRFREMVNSSTNDLDDDDDGLYDAQETSPTNLPGTNPETWNNGEVHIWYIYGRTDPLSPDTDGDLLPDGLESGWRGAASATDTNVDTNGDGYMNFIQDLDPPFYNTVPDNNSLPNYVFNDSRTKLIHGTMTDPSNADSDYDGIKDGIEDANRNGWVDGDGLPLYNSSGDPWTERTTSGDWPDGSWDSAWTETDPNNADTDGDGASDGYGEDTNFNGRIEGDANSNRTWEAGEQWTETDPLNPDTDGDGLPDGWEKQYNFDPFDDGIIGHTNLMTGLAVTSTLHGAGGNPDGDVYTQGSNTNAAYSNIVEYLNGTNPRYADTGEPPPEDELVIGRGEAIGTLDSNGTNYQEFTDWTWDDLIILDEYEGNGGNNQQGDIYPRWDGFDTSRDIVAFYARDGGALPGGDGKFYFRLDFLDLQAYAEEGYLDIYVVIDTGQPTSGEMGLPDDVDVKTSNRWEAVVAVYESNSGRVYVDTDPNSNSTTVAHGYNLTPFGVEVRDQNHADGFGEAYFNSELDAVEFSISRRALTDGAGWNGLDPDDLNYQVFTVKDGTCNGCGEDGAAGAGDIGGRNDICDSIYDDNIAEDYWEAQDGISDALGYWFSGGNQGGRAKIAMMVHGNQAIQPGSYIQEYINTGEGAGYYRPLAVHEVYEQPLNLHITPTLASALEWAKTDPADPESWRTGATASGPALNDWIAQLAATDIVYLAASTFSDHILPYFTSEYNQDNVNLANDVLEEIYDVQFTTNSVFWTPERVLEAKTDNTFQKILDLGYQYTLIDQETHLFNWFGRTDAMGDNGYSINKIHGVKCFPINNLPTEYRFDNEDNGLSLALRKLFLRRAQGSYERIVTIFSNWEDFTDNDSADAYDLNLRWMANHPWLAVVGYEQIAREEIDLSGSGFTTWQYGIVDRGSPSLEKTGHNWLNHATEGDYDNWFVGAANEEGLESKVFEIRPGTNVFQRYGMIYSSGNLTDTWTSVNAINNASVWRLARSVLHASVFQTAFHDEDKNDLSRWSTGDYIYPATSTNSLASFAKYAQSQTRKAAIYAQVDAWVTSAEAGSLDSSVVATNVDADLDGEEEYLLYNDRLMGLFERIGGRMIAAWVRDILSGEIYQAAGNQSGYAGSENEEEGAWNVNTNNQGYVEAYRTSAFKDWWVGTPNYVNDLYTPTYWTNGWRFTSSDGNLQKTITLGVKSNAFQARYQLSGALAGQALYIRHGLSPNLYDLLLRGQSTLSDLSASGGAASLENTNYHGTVTAAIDYSGAGYNANLVADAVDDDASKGVEFHTINMRNQAQTHQVEIVGTNDFTFALRFSATPSDWDADGMPNTYEDTYGLDATNSTDGADDDDDDGFLNRDEYIANTNPTNDQDYLSAYSITGSTGFVVQFPAKAQRRYRIWYANDSLIAPAWSNATPSAISVGSDMIYNWLDDGSETEPAPNDSSLDHRFYRIEVSLPE